MIGFNRCIGQLYKHLKRPMIIEPRISDVLRFFRLGIRLIHEVDEFHDMLLALIINNQILNEHVHPFLFVPFSEDVHEDWMKNVLPFMVMEGVYLFFELYHFGFACD